MTLQPVIHNYLLVCRIEGLPPFAVKLFGGILDDFLKFHGDMKVSDLKPVHVNQYVASLEGYKARQAKGIMRMFCNWLLAQSKMRYVPAQPRHPSQIFVKNSKIRRSWAV